MNIIIIVLTVLIALFVLVNIIGFVIGFVQSSTLGSDKKRRARALISLSQMTEDQRTVLKDIFLAYKANDIETANRISEETPSEVISFLINFFDYNNRPIEYSSGKAGKLIWMGFEERLIKMGYSEAVSKIIPVVIMDNYNDMLEKMKKNTEDFIDRKEGKNE